MHDRRNTRSSLVAVLAALAFAAAGCGKESPKPPEKVDEAKAPTSATPVARPGEKPPEGDKAPAPLKDPKALAEEFGVQPGPIEAPKGEGPEAVLTEADGKVLLRRVGEEDFAAAKVNAAVFSGDQIKTEADATATLTLLDQSVVQVGADSAVAVGDRDVTADPASSAAVP
jgi:hypothetical protein